MKTPEYIAEIAIQGDQVLSFVNCTQERAVYEVIGFDEPKIIIVDYRQKPIQAIYKLLATGDAHQFAPIFNNPALITIQEDVDGTLLVELNESNGLLPDKMFWIAIGIRDSIPVYNYRFERIAPLTEDAFAFVALFDIPTDSARQSSDALILHNQI
ncbi:MAG: hypothetical protein ACOYZ6_12775 [Chloroflexota bacterium]